MTVFYSMYSDEECLRHECPYEALTAYIEGAYQDDNVLETVKQDYVFVHAFYPMQFSRQDRAGIAQAALYAAMSHVDDYMHGDPEGEDPPCSKMVEASKQFADTIVENYTVWAHTSLSGSGCLISMKHFRKNYGNLFKGLEND